MALPSLFSGSSIFLFPSKSSPSNKFRISFSTPHLRLTSPFARSIQISSKNLFRFQLFSQLEEVIIAVEEGVEENQQENQEGKTVKKLYAKNLPWSLSATDIKVLFGGCGNVKDVEIIKQKDGRNRGFAFITMDTGEEALAAVEKFDSSELLGRIIRVELAKNMKKPSPPTSATVLETRHKIYASNLAWKVRSSDLKEFFAASSNPVSARVVFDRPSGSSAGYGFVSFSTKEEVEAAISALDRKELMGRPLRLKLSQKKVDESGNEAQEAESSEEKLEES
eukprot:TRINITY_DN17431_c0_g1_i1.p1 TRINITY_DN17431_c0_g1~~TRINITY_DN17431_c0_g1_i1.p1  ORF type:complete len:280 (-),score=62.33 TRINITY_DN17431_c0_g1_i1:472-1311(-)